jgi:hypothetical protein
MKKILSIIIALAGWSFVQAQTSGVTFTTLPSSFTAEDVVKVIVDVSAVPNLAGKEPLYIWTWEPGEPAPGNGTWENSNEARKMVKEGPNKWSWTFTPSQYYGKSPAEIPQISFLVKAKDGSGDTKTTDIILKVAPLVFVPSVFRMFPKSIGQTDVVTFYLDQSLATDPVTERMIPATAKISLWDTQNKQIDVEKTITLTKQGARLFSYTFLPGKMFAIPAIQQLNKMKVIFKGKGKDVNGNDIDVESPPFEYGFDPLQ